MRIRMFLALLVFVCACTSNEPATRIVVRLDAGPTVRMQGTSLRVRLFGGADGGTHSLDETRAFASLDWPAELVIAPEGGDATRTFELLAEILDRAGMPIAAVRARTGFVRDETRVLTLDFEDSCLRMLGCNAAQSCSSGRCIEARIDPSTLPRLGAEEDGGRASANDACALSAWYRDSDQDGEGDPTSRIDACVAPEGYVPSSVDCDDRCPLCNAGGVETCDGTRDEDCDGTADEGCACQAGESRVCPGGLGEGACEPGTQTCTEGLWSVCQGRIEPAAEDCDGVDDDCDGEVDESLLRECGSGIGACGRGMETCSAGAWVDCTAEEPEAETCNAIDDDCDGRIDEETTLVFFRDADEDGFGTPVIAMNACTAPTGFVENDDDCNDGCSDCHPGASELCEGTRDENCEMGVDEGCACTTGSSRPCPDGVDTGACQTGMQNCTGGRWGACMGRIGPALETCNALDDDCDSRVDEALVQSCGPSAEIGICRRGTQMCSAGSWSSCSGAVAMMAETCNGLDDDCDGMTDDGVLTTFYLDADNDGYGVEGMRMSACMRPTGYAARPGDCDDARDSIHPSATEVCDSRDQDCDGMADEGLGCSDAGDPGPRDAGVPVDA